jgi:hypothetical protein
VCTDNFIRIDWPKESPNVSALVTTGWRTPNSALANELDALEIPYVALGDCLAPRTVEEAVLEAFTFARQIAAEQT